MRKSLIIFFSFIAAGVCLFGSRYFLSSLFVLFVSEIMAATKSYEFVIVPNQLLAIISTPWTVQLTNGNRAQSVSLATWAARTLDREMFERAWDSEDGNIFYFYFILFYFKIKLL
jgi:hypothetical protein